VLAAITTAGGRPSRFDRLGTWIVVAPATGIALLALIGAALRRRADDVGLLLPAYLAGPGLFVFPFLALLTALIKSDVLCS
jgi:hypothetical protein